jgi:hypothetical protein
MPLLLKFEVDLDGLKEGIRTLESDLGFRDNDSGIPITVRKKEGDIKVALKMEKVLLNTVKASTFFARSVYSWRPTKNSRTFISSKHHSSRP